jgi:hypothetical protein
MPRSAFLVSFVAVKLDAQGAVDLYFLCPADGRVQTEMLSTWNGLDSVVVTLDSSWAGKNQAEAHRLWCEKEKAWSGVRCSQQGRGESCTVES